MQPTSSSAVFTDDDGTRLLFMDDIQRITGWKNETVRHYATAGQRARREGTDTAKHMPAPRKKVRFTRIKKDGKPLVVWTPLWREDDIADWLTVRGVIEA